MSRIALVDEKGCDTFRSLFLIAKPNSKVACRLVRKIERCRANMYVFAHIAHCDVQNRERGGEIPRDRHPTTAMMARLGGASPRALFVRPAIAFVAGLRL
jgi:hypothetical protein